MRVSLRFSGDLLTQQCRQYLLTGDQLVKTAEKDTDPYVGNLPDRFVTSAKTEPPALLNIMNTLANHIQNLRGKQGIPRREMPGRLKTWLQSNPLPMGLDISYIGSGQFGSVFKLSTPEQQYAFKVLKYRNVHNIGEIANGAFFTALNARDISQFYMGNVQNGWYLSEVIDDKTDLKARPGKTLAEHGITFSDDDGEADEEYEYEDYSGNRIRGIRVDYGSLDLEEENNPWRMPLSNLK